MDDVGLSTGETVELSVIVPARNEGASLGACLESLVAQSELGFELGRDWELIVVDDASTDSTRRIAESIEGVTVMAAPLLDVTVQTGFTGKTNACWAGAQAAQGRVLIFTDADTIHEPGGLSRARHEREKYEVGLLSYSPKQLTSGPLQRMLMPLVFAELAIGFPMKRVNDPADRTAAANGQFIMVDAQNYFDLGGHRAIGREVLEDVALASLFKRAKRGLRFRYAPDALATRMYRSNRAMIEGWTKNLALLFGAPLMMAALRLIDFLLIILVPVIAFKYPFLNALAKTLLWVIEGRVIYRFYSRTAKSNFPALDCVLAFFGLPLLIFLLVRSWMQVKLTKRVEWKGRSYRTGR